jgi:PilZ domain
MRGPQHLDRLRDPAMDSDAVAEPGRGEKEQRRHVRKRVLWTAKLETKDGESFECIVLNVSRSGAQLRLKAPIAPQTEIAVALGSLGALKADVVWQRGDKMGIRFCAAPEEVAKIIGDGLSL